MKPLDPSSDKISEFVSKLTSQNRDISIVDIKEAFKVYKIDHHVKDARVTIKYDLDPEPAAGRETTPDTKVNISFKVKRRAWSASGLMPYFSYYHGVNAVILD